MMKQFWVVTLADGSRVLACHGMRDNWDHFYGFSAIVAQLGAK
jgi:hypothetical protein